MELPTCPVCLERMDSSVTGLVTVPCLHTYQCVPLSSSTKVQAPDPLPLDHPSQLRLFEEVGQRRFPLSRLSVLVQTTPSPRTTLIQPRPPRNTNVLRLCAFVLRVLLDD